MESFWNSGYPIGIAILIVGFIVRWDGKMYDASLDTMLKKFSDKIIN